MNLKMTGMTAALGLMLFCFTHEAYAQANPLIGQTNSGSRAFKEVGIDQKLNEQIPLDLKFRNEKGETITLDEYFGEKPVIISLVYYNCPMLCTQILNGMVETFKTIQFTAGTEFDVITVSIDPREGHELAAEKKAHYVEEYERQGVEGGWHFLTGDQESITRLADAVGFRYMYDEQTGHYAHASGIMVATPKGKLARYLYGIEYVAKDLRFSLMEAAENRIGTPVDKLLLLCYHYDPLTGTYGMMVSNLLRVGGGLAIVLLGGYMFMNFRRDRKRSLQPVQH
ncbi:MAG: SCO family protein [Bacteroidota bacterium]